jgi:hypothetical protein
MTAAADTFASFVDVLAVHSAGITDLDAGDPLRWLADQHG